MNENFDRGDILLQQDVPKPIVESSMGGVYLYVYEHFSKMLLEAIKNMIAGNFIVPQETTSSVFGLPSREDINRFRKAGGKIIRWQDIFKAP